MGRCSWAAALIALLASLALAGAAAADGVTNAGDDLRTGWYPDEGAITPQLVSGGTFGQLWSAPVNGQVYAQPLLSPSGTLIVATENDKVYGLNPATGAQQWTNDLGTPWNPADIGCGDIAPSIGTTATPVIDPSTNTVYLTHKTYVSGTPAWFMDALDVATGHERPGFPVRLSGTADNDPAMSFLAANQQQRPGLLLMDGVIYAGFGGHCDYGPYQGWVFGVSTAGQITARWVDNTSGQRRRRHLAVGGRARLRRGRVDPAEHRQRRSAQRRPRPGRRLRDRSASRSCVCTSIRTARSRRSTSSRRSTRGSWTSLTETSARGRSWGSPTRTSAPRRSRISA